MKQKEGFNKSFNYEIPDENLLYNIMPENAPPLDNPRSEIVRLLRNPIGVRNLAELLNKKDDILVIADDITRPTPRKVILPPVINELNRAGISDEHITILIALGTHRMMTQKEIRECFGSELVNRVEIVNHHWDKPNGLVNIGTTEEGIPIVINRKVKDADFVIGVGSIVPHCQAGWSGGAKIIQPGVCSSETTGKTHMFAAEQPNYLQIVGQINNPVRQMIEKISLRAGLDFILNVVFNADYKVTKVVSGDPIQAHRTGVEKAQSIFVQVIESLADIVIIDAEPANIDYWQGIKPLVNAYHGVKSGGIIILVGDFPEGVSATHKELSQNGSIDPDEIFLKVKSGKIKDEVCAASLMLHALVKRDTTIICVSTGISRKHKRALGFIHVENVQSALSRSFNELGYSAKVGVIHNGGDTLPKLLD